MRVPLPILGPDSKARSKERSPQRTVNLYLRPKKYGDKGELVLHSCPGLLFHAQVAATGARSNFVEFKGKSYVAFGDSLYRLDGTGASSKIGTLSTSGGRIEMVAGRDYLLIVDGTAGYTYNGTTFATIADADFPNGATHCDYLNSRFVVNAPNSDVFYASELEDATAWSGLSYATGEADPDPTRAIAASYKNLYLVGARTTEIWYSTGNQDFAFEPYAGGVLEIGIQAPHSLVRSSAGLFWLATSREGDVFVVQAQGLQYRVISDDISWALTEMSVTDDAIGSVYRFDGRTIYRLTFPTADKSFEFYAEDGFWCERKSKGIGRHRAAGMGYLNNKTFVADYQNGKVYTLDADTFTEDGDYIERVRDTQTLHEKDLRIAFHALYLDVQSGVGLISGQGENPQVMLSWSDDEGNTWSSEIWASMGRLGNYRHRAAWRRLGSSRQRIYRFRVTDPVEVTILGGYADITAQRS
jgi:hypothetical protein